MTDKFRKLNSLFIDSRFNVKNSTVILKSVEDTNEFGAKIAEVMFAQDQAPTQLSFCGEMGSGKSTLITAIIQYFLPKINVPSPSFSIMNSYDIPQINRQIHHCDLFRIKGRTLDQDNLEELYNIGFFEAIKSGHCLVEWPINGIYTDDICLNLSQNESNNQLQIELSRGIL
ncbi:MAG: tRNA (adenosine(37)-N6)-threonylcarbamoyltransferase complex ATPase subunit type 1 TsaE [Alphaproteobacteria bacterium]|nr:tRNA (adenosine(37)-N6)-threonylcarbamoyltransferase complex ATPase subunit type 1 TsaE [Alphaproteobacteria bacterium]